MTLTGLCCQGREEEKEAGKELSLTIHNNLFPCRVGLHDAMK